MKKKFSYIIFNKPFQVLTQFSPENEKVTLKAFFPKIDRTIYPVGRLDYDSEGLLFLTNDKELNHKLLNPEFVHERNYWVQVEGIPTPESLDTLRNGTIIHINGIDYLTKPAKVRLLESEEVETLWERNPPIRQRASIPTTWLSITITEGKNRQVRRMTASVNLPTLRLIRHSIGGISVKGLTPGQSILISEKTKDKLFQS